MSRLHVFYRDELVGIVSRPAPGSMHFQYEDSWINSEAAFPISVSLPLNNERFSQVAASNFFANLLPEAHVRRRICKKLGISEGNDFELLNAIGGDCAGALTLTTNDAPPPLKQDYELITDEQLANWSIGAPDAFSAVTGQQGVRLSLAGAQDKLPVMFKGGQFLLPVGNSPSTHILKFASRDYSHLPENETFITMLAASIGLPTVTIELSPTEKSRIAVVTRYDRKPLPDGYSRIHQEDFCQAMGINPNNKYEKEGGPGFQDCVELIKQSCSVPALEIDKLIRWSLFNLMVHNADAHGKNLSLIFRGRTTELTPFYDLVCTRNYENLDRKMAMTYSGKDDPAQIHKQHLIEFANQIGVSTGLVADALPKLQQDLSAAIPKAAATFAKLYGESPILERLPMIVQKRMNKAMQSF